jgi:hypothetical protein
LEILSGLADTWNTPNINREWEPRKADIPTLSLNEANEVAIHMSFVYTAKQ